MGIMILPIQPTRSLRLAQVMEPSGADLLDMLFERQEEPFASGAFAGAQGRLASPLRDHAYGCIPETADEAWMPSEEQVRWGELGPFCRTLRLQASRLDSGGKLGQALHMALRQRSL